MPHPPHPGQLKPAGPGCLGGSDLTAPLLPLFERNQFLLRAFHDTFAHQVAQRKDHGIRDRVYAAGPLLATRDKAAFQQQVQVLGDIRLVRVKILHQLCHRFLRLLQRLKYSETEGLAEVAETARYKLQRSARQRDLTHPGQSITLYASIPTTTQGGTPMMTVEVAVRMLAGVMILLSLALAHFFSPY